MQALRGRPFSNARPVVSRRSAVVVQAVQDLRGTVVSVSMQKTVVVETERLSADVKYLARKKVTRRYLAHDEMGDLAIGDFVLLSGSRPLSKTKRFTVAEVLRKAQ
jgi:small subunit ribosomal protein S17